MNMLNKCRAVGPAAFGPLLCGVLLAGCSSGASSPAPAPAPSAAPVAAAPTTAAVPLAGDVETTHFAAILNVDLSKMTRRTSGLYVLDTEIGTGNVAARTRTAVVKYAGYLPDGTMFDSGEITITLGTNKVIRAWEDGVLGMRVGGKRRLVSPPHLAYGARGAPPTIPPNAVLVFDMQLTQVY